VENIAYLVRLIKMHSNAVFVIHDMEYQMANADIVEIIALIAIFLIAIQQYALNVGMVIF
jgi:hypothetical protein